MPTVVSVTPFAEWLESELKLRGWSRSYLAATMEKRPQTIYTWFNEDRIPSPEMCRLIAAALRIPEEIPLQQAGHLTSVEPAPRPDLPDWASLLPMLSKADAEYVGRLVRSLATDPAQPDEPPSQGAP